MNGLANNKLCNLSKRETQADLCSDFIMDLTSNELDERSEKYKRISKKQQYEIEFLKSIILDLKEELKAAERNLNIQLDTNEALDKEVKRVSSVLDETTRNYATEINKLKNEIDILNQSCLENTTVITKYLEIIKDFKLNDTLKTCKIKLSDIQPKNVKLNEDKDKTRNTAIVSLTTETSNKMEVNSPTQSLMGQIFDEYSVHVTRSNLKSQILNKKKIPMPNKSDRKFKRENRKELSMKKKITRNKINVIESDEDDIENGMKEIKLGYPEYGISASDKDKLLETMASGFTAFVKRMVALIIEEDILIYCSAAGTLIKNVLKPPIPEHLRQRVLKIWNKNNKDQKSIKDVNGCLNRHILKLKRARKLDDDAENDKQVEKKLDEIEKIYNVASSKHRN